MQYSDTTNKNGLLQMVEFYTGVGDATISGTAALKAQVTQLINNRYHQIVTMILDSSDEWDFDDPNHTDLPVATLPLVATQRDYTIPVATKLLKLKRVDVTWDGSTYYRASPLDSGEMSRGLGTDANTDNDFDLTEPFYDVIGNSLWLYPMATAAQVTAGGKIRLEYLREIDEFATTDTTQEPGLDEPFHNMIAVGAALDWAVAKGLQCKNDLAAIWGDYEQRLRKYYGRRNEDRLPLLKSVYNETYGN